MAQLFLYGATSVSSGDDDDGGAMEEGQGGEYGYAHEDEAEEDFHEIDDGGGTELDGDEEDEVED